jgi:hypothetical protein
MTELGRLRIVLARPYAPRVAHLALYAKKSRARKKNIRRLEKEQAKTFPMEQVLKPNASRVFGRTAGIMIVDELHDFGSEGKARE